MIPCGLRNSVEQTGKEALVGMEEAVNLDEVLDVGKKWMIGVQAIHERAQDFLFELFRHMEEKLPRKLVQTRFRCWDLGNTEMVQHVDKRKFGNFLVRHELAVFSSSRKFRMGSISWLDVVNVLRQEPVYGRRKIGIAEIK